MMAYQQFGLRVNIVLVIFDSLRKDCVGAYGSPSWGRVSTPQLDRLAQESIVFMRAYPNVLPTLPARVALYTGRQLYPFAGGETRLRGDFVGAPGWGPIPEDWPTLAEQLSEAGYRTALISDLYHQFKPSKKLLARLRPVDVPAPGRNDPALPARPRPDAESDRPAAARASSPVGAPGRRRRASCLDARLRAPLSAERPPAPVPKADFYPARVFTEGSASGWSRTRTRSGSS